MVTIAVRYSGLYCGATIVVPRYAVVYYTDDDLALLTTNQVGFWRKLSQINSLRKEKTVSICPQSKKRIVENKQVFSSNFRILLRKKHGKHEFTPRWFEIFLNKRGSLCICLYCQILISENIQSFRWRSIWPGKFDVVTQTSRNLTNKHRSSLERKNVYLKVTNTTMITLTSTKCYPWKIQVSLLEKGVNVFLQCWWGNRFGAF